MCSLVILGASGFVGRAILAQRNIPFPLKAIVRKIPSEASQLSDKITWFEKDLLQAQSLNSVLEEDDIVINTVYINTNDEAENLYLIDQIIKACIQKKVKKLVHCSTAVVVGTAKNSLIDEAVLCLPSNQYEQVKFAIEQRVLQAELNGLKVAILRPTAIVGPQGKNLLKLANSLINGNSFVNYLRASLFGKRKMHLVPVNNVAAALLHLAVQESLSTSPIFNISADDDPENNYLKIEKILLKALGLKKRKIPVLPLPLLFLSFLLKLKGRSESNLQRVYDSKKLLSTNFVPVHSLNDAIQEFAKTIRTNTTTLKEGI